MAIETVARSTNQAINENILRRDIGDKIAELEPNDTALLVMTTNAKRKRATISPRVERIEDAMRVPWGQVNNGTTDYSSVATGVLVADATIFAAGDEIAVQKANSSAAAEEIIRVTSITGSTLTVTRNIGGGADTIGATAALRVIGSAYAEGAALGTPRTTDKTIALSYCQIFREPIQFTRTAMSTQIYGDADYEYQVNKALREHKRQIEAAGLWSRPSETLASPNTIRTTMGFKSRVTSNLTNGGTTVTLTLFNTFSETVFRYGSKTKLFIAAPRILSAINFFSQNRLLTEVGQTVFGVDIQRFQLPHGLLLLARNWLMEAGIAGGAGYDDEGYVIDLDKVELRPLSANGISRDTHINRDVVKSGIDAQTDECLTEAAWLFLNEKTHARIYNASAYQ